MRSYSRMINEMLTQLYQDEKLWKCLKEEIRINPERIKMLHFVVMNYDRMSKMEIRERAYCYANSIQEEELLARQIFLCLLHLANT